MSEWRARVEFNPLSMEYEVSAIRQRGDRDEVVVGMDEFGGLVVQEIDPGVRIDPFLRIPAALMDAVEEAMEPYRKPDPDRHLVEALEIERKRVDIVLGRLIPDPMENYFPLKSAPEED